MHSFARHSHHKADVSSTQKKTKGLILDQGWRYDLGIWFIDTFLFRGQLRQLRLRTASLALMQPGEVVLDVGCGTGTLAMEVQKRVGKEEMRPPRFSAFPGAGFVWAHKS